MLKNAFSKYTSPTFTLFNLIASKLPFLISLGAMLDCVTLPHASTLSQRLAGKDSAHGQQERQRIFSFCPVWLSLLIVWNLLGVSQTCKASRWTRRNGTVKLNLRKIRKLFWKGECVGSGCWLDFALPHCRDTWYWYAGLSPPWSPGLSSSQFKAPL